MFGLNRSPVQQMRDSNYDPNTTRGPYEPHTRQSLSDSIAAKDKEARDYNDRTGGGVDGDTSTRCYITTAAVTHMGLPDMCEELETLRYFRDNVMMQTEEGRNWITEYYRTAPNIVKRLNARPYSDHIYKGMFRHYIVPAVAAVKQGNNALAFEYYHGLVEYAHDLACEN